MFIASVLKLSASTMICHAIYDSINKFLRNVDRSKERDNRFETKFEEEKKIMLRTCLEKSFDWILFYQRKFIWRLMWTWHIFLLLTFDLHVHICSLNQIFSFLLFVILLIKHDLWQSFSSQRRNNTIITSNFTSRNTTNTEFIFEFIAEMFDENNNWQNIEFSQQQWQVFQI